MQAERNSLCELSYNIKLNIFKIVMGLLEDHPLQISTSNLFFGALGVQKKHQISKCDKN